jgi:hypothetical protein
MVQDFENRHDFSILTKLKDMLFGKDRVQIFGEIPREHQDRVVHTMLDVVNRKKAEKVIVCFNNRRGLKD